MTEYTVSGDFRNLTTNLQRILGFFNMSKMDKYGQRGVEILRELTPTDTGLARDSWDYKVSMKDDECHIDFINYDVEDGVSVVVLIDSGHVRRDGTWFEGYNFINPAIDMLIKEIQLDFKEEVR